MTTMKNRDRFTKQSYTVCQQLAVHCFDDDQREIVRRFAQTPEHEEMLKCHALVDMSKGEPSEALAARFAKAAMATIRVAADVCDEVLAQTRARDAAEEEERRKARANEGAVQ
jgi:hypothetical protein